MSDTIEVPDHDKPKAERNPVKTLTQILIIGMTVLGVWYVLSDRYTPYTNEGAVKGLTVFMYLK